MKSPSDVSNQIGAMIDLKSEKDQDRRQVALQLAIGWCTNLAVGSDADEVIPCAKIFDHFLETGK